MSERTGTYGTAALGHERRGRGKTIIGGAIGHFIEWYDWSIYGFLAGIFAGQMFPSGDPTEQTVQTLAGLLEPDDVLIDGGNSNFRDSMRRADELAERGIHFIDSGTSGGICRIALRSTRSIRVEPFTAAVRLSSSRVAVTPSITSPSARSSALSSPIDGSTREM